MRVALWGWLGLGTYTSLARPRRPGELHSALDTGHKASRTNPAAHKRAPCPHTRDSHLWSALSAGPAG